MRESLTRASGRTSYCVTTGPVFVATTVAGIWKERSFSSMMRTLRRWSWRAASARLAWRVEQRHAGQLPVPSGCGALCGRPRPDLSTTRRLGARVRSPILSGWPAPARRRLTRRSPACRAGPMMRGHDGRRRGDDRGATGGRRRQAPVARRSATRRSGSRAPGWAAARAGREVARRRAERWRRLDPPRATGMATAGRAVLAPRERTAPRRWPPRRRPRPRPRCPSVGERARRTRRA